MLLSLRSYEVGYHKRFFQLLSLHFRSICKDLRRHAEGRKVRGAREVHGMGWILSWNMLKVERRKCDAVLNVRQSCHGIRVQTVYGRWGTRRTPSPQVMSHIYSRFTFPTKPNIVRFDFLDISWHFVTLRPRFPAATPRITWSRGSTGAAEHEMNMSEPIWKVFRMQDLRSSISKSSRFRNHFWSPQVIEVNQRRVTLGRDEAGRNQKIYRDFVGFQYISY